MAYFKQLYVQVLIGIVAGIVLGIVDPPTAVAMKPLGDAFIGLLRMMLAPIIFCSVVVGLTHVANMRQLGRLALKALIYFEVLTTVAMAIGFVAVNIFEPGVGLHATDLAVDQNVSRIATSAGNFTAIGFFLSIIPHTLVDAFAKGEILQVLLISVLTGAALSVGGVGKDSVLIRGITEGQDVLFRILGFIMKLAPIGAFGAITAAVGAFGAATLLYLAKLVILYWASAVFFVVFGLGAVLATLRLSIFKVLGLIREELLIVLGTASSEVVLPRVMEKLERAGCDGAVVGFVVPSGYSFNLDGTSIYMAIAVGFIAQATDTPFTLGQQLGVLAILLLTSKGGTTVAGGAFIKLAATLQTVRSLPLNGLGLLFGVDRLMATCTALVNVIGNVVATLYIARSENGFDRARWDAYLTAKDRGEEPAPAPVAEPAAAPQSAH
ncbi:cation:dicarboxylase symporter family transporter [Rhodoplanes sp. TEM]|uniref:Cation:dicarboxylase symporter family transporter n=1 Tax=Rhodoplanes tepidamans TaxID=200616 RepID=A0ABT5JD75_RHOTP|nr:MULTISPECIES: cation:dicarboxylase symporter family transporter [Rhodoplanes]MDC7787234.1 cation:dicarboxylase symporter family transporter [Rhodoplanes tepidamans]MDC7986579.1 cation:dicarboxylase symporter family transporter [Rhodoplanes sp. TEM]MDQ0357768.1 aerobic C4-dicarboxylate transport protein [Rhodoplanes tepidamans]